MQDYSKSILESLREIIDSPVCELDYNNNFELIVAVILSAQCTDRRVNMVTPSLFAQYPTVYDLAEANIADVANIIRPCGTYMVKAKNIVNTAKILVQKYNGVVPSAMEDLMALPGVGRKTASVVQAVGFQIPAMPVDTHVLRVSNRLGFVSSDDPKKVEDVLKNIFNKSDWIEVHHLLLLFGRYYCKAIKYDCINCKLQKYCQKYKNDNKK